MPPPILNSALAADKAAAHENTGTKDRKLIEQTRSISLFSVWMLIGLTAFR
jgi:hypothetical protein